MQRVVHLHQIGCAGPQYPPRHAPVRGLLPARHTGFVNLMAPLVATSRTMPSAIMKRAECPLWAFATVWPVAGHFRSSPNNGHHQTVPACLKRATSGSPSIHSITESALGRMEVGKVRSSALAVLRFATR